MGWYNIPARLDRFKKMVLSVSRFNLPVLLPFVRLQQVCVWLWLAHLDQYSAAALNLPFSCKLCGCLRGMKILCVLSVVPYEYSSIFDRIWISQLLRSDMGFLYRGRVDWRDIICIFGWMTLQNLIVPLLIEDVTVISANKRLHVDVKKDVESWFHKQLLVKRVKEIDKPVLFENIIACIFWTKHPILDPLDHFPIKSFSKTNYFLRAKTKLVFLPNYARN